MIIPVIEFLVLLSTFGSWIRMYTRGGHGLLSGRGAASLKYYTILSNLFAGLTSFVVLILLLMNGADSQLPVWTAVLKFASALSVFITFLTTAAFLGPTMGYRAMFAGELLFLHGIGPCLAVLSFFCFSKMPRLSFGTTFLAVIPTVLYAVYYIRNILKNGIGEGRETNDWYGFLGGKLERIPAVLFIFLGGAWALAFIFWLIRF